MKEKYNEFMNFSIKLADFKSKFSNQVLLILFSISIWPNKWNPLPQ